MSERQVFLSRVEHALARGDKTYGAVAGTFSRVATHWAAILDVPVREAQVALCLAAMKIARLAAAPGHRDSWIDLAGYAACGAEVAVRLGLQWEKAARMSQRRIPALVIGNARTYHEAVHLLRCADREHGEDVARVLHERLDAEGVGAATALYVGVLLLVQLIAAAPARERRAIVGGLCDLVLRCSLGLDDDDAVH